MRDDPTERHNAAFDPAPWESDGRDAARGATNALRDALARAGMTDDLPSLRAESNAFGRGFVGLGHTSPAGAGRLAELLRTALATGLEELARSGPPDRPAALADIDVRADRADADGGMPCAVHDHTWTRATDGVGALAAQLTTLGLDSDFPGLSAAVGASGVSVVRLGPVRPQAARILAELIVSGAEAEAETGRDRRRAVTAEARRPSDRVTH
ncbi:hypothetical protein ACIQAC_18235 [Streptomyces sp. NPDC088387]|uniref:hypothetical protein n=1 Tax=Streptomyces sp. NPDC088387 TaxID=3365859 RepID=UPI0037FDC444